MSRRILSFEMRCNGRMKAALLSLLLLAPAWPQTAGSRAFRVDELRTPPGYEVSLYANVPRGGLRHMAFGPNGVLYAAARSRGWIVAIPEAGRVVNVLEGLRGPHSLEFRDGSLFVALDDGVVRFDDAGTGDLVIRTRAQRLITLPTGGQHTTRTLRIAPDGSLFVSAGSTCNFCNEGDRRRAAVMRYNADGSGEQVFATGLRNSVGLDFHPETGELWATDHGGDNIGDNEPPEEINVIREGGNYGWPDCYSSNRPVPSRVFPQVNASRCAAAQAPEVEMQGHSAPLGLAFYRGDDFPVSFRNQMLVAFHGSWNRSQPTGYKVVRVTSAGVEDFLWGFLDERTRTTSGRPVQAIPGPDGAVYVSDDATGNIYAVRYTGPRMDENGITRQEDGRHVLTGRRLVREGEAAQLFAGDTALEILSAQPDRIEFLLPESVAGEVRIRVESGGVSDWQSIWL